MTGLPRAELSCWACCSRVAPDAPRRHRARQRSTAGPALRHLWTEALTIGGVAGILVTPWMTLLTSVESVASTQPGMMFTGGASWIGRIGSQVVFYIQRVPDQLTGPFVEFGSAFHGSAIARWVAIVWSLVATTCIWLGIISTVSSRRLRFAGLTAVLTVSVLLCWPYLEAGRFLVPLIPFLLLGAVEGLSRLVVLLAELRSIRPRRKRIRWFAATLLLAASLPYSIYMLAFQRTRTTEAMQRNFDATCNWVAKLADRPGTVLSRHPGEVYWQTKRRGIEVSAAERHSESDAPPDSVAATIRRGDVAYLLIDRDRYAGERSSPLSRFVDRHPYAVRNVQRNGQVAVIELISHR